MLLHLVSPLMVACHGPDFYMEIGVYDIHITDEEHVHSFHKAKKKVLVSADMIQQLWVGR